MKALKKLFMVLNYNMKIVAVVWALCLIPVAIWPALGWVVGGCIAALCVIMYIGDYPMNWIAEVEIPDCPGY